MKNLYIILAMVIMMGCSTSKKTYQFSSDSFVITNYYSSKQYKMHWPVTEAKYFTNNMKVQIVTNSFVRLYNNNSVLEYSVLDHFEEDNAKVYIVRQHPQKDVFYWFELHENSNHSYFNIFNYDNTGKRDKLSLAYVIILEQQDIFTSE